MAESKCCQNLQGVSRNRAIIEHPLTSEHPCMRRNRDIGLDYPTASSTIPVSVAAISRLARSHGQPCTLALESTTRRRARVAGLAPPT